jgi:hypothetical protein
MSQIVTRSIVTPDNSPVSFPYGINIGTPNGSGINDIGIAGQIGFGVGICPSALPAGMTELSGTRDRFHDNYGNYQYSDGSIMVWMPAFFYKYGTGSNGLALNEVDIEPFGYFANVATANSAGYALHRAFYDGGVIQPGVFVDKYLVSNNGGIASSVKNGIALTSAVRGGIAASAFASLTGAPANNLGGAVAVAKTRGVNFFVSSRFIFAALALLSYAHGKASTSTTHCAWYHATNNFPKGNNNNALGDAQDASIAYVWDGNSAYLGCGRTGSANFFARTTHNGQNCGVADLNGVVWEQTPGITHDGTNLYILKPAVSMKNVTGGNSLATDLYGATGIAALYDSLGTSYESLTGSNANKVFGNNSNQVLSAATSGNGWNFAGAGLPLALGVGGSNAFGNDYALDYKPNEMAPLSGGSWSDSSVAGVWSFHLSVTRAVSLDSIGCRSALYL